MPLNISTDRGQTVIDPATLPSGSIVKVYGTVPTPYRTALTALGVHVTTTEDPGTANIAALVYNQRTVSPTALARAVSHNWALIPMANITPTAPTYI